MAFDPFLTPIVMASTIATGAAGLADFEAHLAAHDSATEALQQWCHARRIGQGPIRARVIEAQSNDPPTRMRRLLGLNDEDRLGMRNVRLSCDDTVLSVAWNWYAPARLTPEMNATLANSDVPFGRVASALRFRRETIDVNAGPIENCPPDTVSTHRALLRLPSGEPLAYLIECYTAANLVQR